MKPVEETASIQKQIAELEKKLADTRARVPKHSVPAAVIAQIDELDEELERLRSRKQESLREQIASTEKRLADVRARVPKHDVPAALVQEMDELDEELAHLRSLLDTAP